MNHIAKPILKSAGFGLIPGALLFTSIMKDLKGDNLDFLLNVLS